MTLGVADPSDFGFLDTSSRRKVVGEKNRISGANYVLLMDWIGWRGTTESLGWIGPFSPCTAVWNWYWEPVRPRRVSTA